MASPFYISGLSALALFASISGANAVTLFGSLTDRELNEGNILQAADSGATIRAGASGSAPAGGRNGLFVFLMPSLGAVANPFASADLGLNLASLTGTPTYNVDLYGLGLQSTDVLTVGAGVLGTNRYYEGNATDASAALIQIDFTTQATNGLGFKNTNATGDAALLAYLNSMYAGGSGAGQYVVFRISPDTDLGTATIGYNYSSADATGTATDPVLTYTIVPEPGAGIMLMGCLGLMVARRRK